MRTIIYAQAGGSRSCMDKKGNAGRIKRFGRRSLFYHPGTLIAMRFAKGKEPSGL